MLAKTSESRSYYRFSTPLLAAGNLYYPCCQNDTSISTVFPDSRIIYSDINEGAIKTLKEHNFEAVVADATKYEPDEQPDIVMLENPSINPAKPASILKENGYLVCNNYHSTANYLHGNEEFDLIGVVTKTGKEEGLSLDKESLDNYFTGIDTDEELKKLRLSWGSTLTYENAINSIKRFGDSGVMKKIEAGETSVMAEYKKVLEKLKDKAIPDTNRIAFQDTDGVTILLDAEFPPKKGVADDLFIFRKKIKVVNE